MRSHDRLRRDPLAFAGMRIGLFGGSFDPAHSGHAHVAKTALHALGLHQVWWLVTPQNPLKPKSGSLATRMQSARARARAPGPAHVVTDIESRLGTQYSADTIAALRRRYPGVQFVWIMGGDCLATFQRWRRWRAIVAAVPIAVVSRERVASRSLKAKPFAGAANARIGAGSARALPGKRPPAWVFLPARLDPTYSTALRAAATNASG